MKNENKVKKLDPMAEPIAMLLAHPGALIAVGGIGLLLAKPILAGSVLSLIGYLSGKVVKRIEQRRSIC
jgi:hypothetical protein